MYAIQNKQILFDHVRRADSFFKRLRGLMGRKSLEQGEALLLENCSRVHTCFMRFEMHAVYLDRDFTVIGEETLRPWRLGKYIKGTKYVLEAMESQWPGVTEGRELLLLENKGGEV